ncbi:MAG: hypothetical protein ACPL0A_03405, partial [Candidatus Micrarchaeia archaeon]
LRNELLWCSFLRQPKERCSGMNFFGAAFLGNPKKGAGDTSPSGWLPTTVVSIIPSFLEGGSGIKEN